MSAFHDTSIKFYQALSSYEFYGLSWPPGHSHAIWTTEGSKALHLIAKYIANEVPPPDPLPSQDDGQVIDAPV